MKISQFYLTVMNCIKLRSFSYFRILYNEIPFEIIKVNGIVSSFNWYVTKTEAANIKIAKYKTKNEKSTALLHEIGHYIDFMKIKKLSGFDKYRSIDIKNIQRKEKVAWKYCFRLSKKYDIELNYKVAKKWLNTYGVEYAVLNNKIKNA